MKHTPLFLTPQGNYRYERMIGYNHHWRTEYTRAPITIARAQEFLKQDLAIIEETVKRQIRIPLKSNQLDALASFAHSIGWKYFRECYIPLYASRGEHELVIEQILAWVDPNWRNPEAVALRRADEANLYRGIHGYWFVPER